MRWPSPLTLAESSTTRKLLRGTCFEVSTSSIRQLVVPPDGAVRIEVSCTLTCLHSDGQARFIFNNDGQVLAYGVLIGVLP